MSNWAKATFAIDSIPSQTFEGFSNGDQWNGWACPFFDFDVAKQVLRASEVNNYAWNYDTERDTFIVRNANDPSDYDPEEFKGVKINMLDETFTIYGIGAFSWIWSETSTAR